jgi:hypothetical protein
MKSGISISSSATNSSKVTRRFGSSLSKSRATANGSLAEMGSATPLNAAALNDEIIDQNVATVTEFYRYCNAKLQELDEKYASPSKGFVPISLNATVDGISGVKIYNEINIDTRFLPSNYPEALRFIITQVNHKISDNDWETSFETVAITNSGNDDNKIYKPSSI